MDFALGWVLVFRCCGCVLNSGFKRSGRYVGLWVCLGCVFCVRLVQHSGVGLDFLVAL